MYTILDVETSSLQGGVVELAMLTIDDDLNVVDEFHSLVNPERPIEPGAFAVHGISDDDVKDAPTLAEIRELAAVSYVIAHHAAFDMRMLTGYINPGYSLCTLALARQYLKNVTNHKLETLQRELDLPPQKSHSALGDVHTTRDLLNVLVPMSGVALATLFKRAAQPKLIHVMPFGKYKGSLMAKVPAEYRAWLLTQSNLDKDLKYTLEKLK